MQGPSGFRSPLFEGPGGCWENSRHFIWDLHKFRESSQPVECFYEAIKHRERKQSIVFMNNLTN